MRVDVTIKARSLPAVVIALFIMCFSQAASAVEVDTWQNEISIYGWFAGVDGTVSLPNGMGREADISYDASEIIENLKMIFMGGYEGRYNKWSIIADLVYMDVGDSTDGPVGQGLASVDLDLKSWILSGAVGYDLVQHDRGLVTLIGGVRYLALDVDTELSVGSIQLGSSGSESLTDAIVGLKGQIQLAENWYIPYYADIGAGGSNLSWQLFAGIGYRFNWGDIRLGYRYLKYDLDDDMIMQDLTMGGPVLGVGFIF